MKTVFFLMLFLPLFITCFQPQTPSSRLHSSSRSPNNNNHIHPISKKSPNPSILTQLAKISANGVDEGNVNMALSLVGSTTSALVSVTFFCALAWKRDALMVSFFIGSILNGILSKILKKIIGESRPQELQTIEMNIKPSDGGMPSSHAMSLSFIGVFTAMNLPWLRIPLVIYVMMSLYYRVKVNLHTPEQIAVGLVLGTSNGLVWYHLCHNGAFGMNVKSFVETHFLNELGFLPWPALIIPVIVGAAVVGSFERRITKWLDDARDKQS